MRIEKEEKKYLRELAKKVAEVAQLPRQKEMVQSWKRHNSLKPGRPMILIFPEGAWNELLPEENLVVSDSFWRGVERDLRWRLYYHQYLQDDSVIDDCLRIPRAINNTGWGVEVRQIRPEEKRGACHYEPVLKEEKDLEKIKFPQVTEDREETERRLEIAQDIFAGILRVELTGVTGLWFSPVDWLATWRGLDNLFIDLTERPAWVHQVMEKITTGTISLLDQYEKSGLLSLNNGNHYVGSGALGFTDQLPQKDFDGKNVRTIDMWGHATAQIFSLVSPVMHEEFALQYEKRVLSRFGLNCYGCCEPLHKKLRQVEKIPRLRRISMSPWVDIGEAAQFVGNRFIFSWKPNPAIIAGEFWEPEEARKMVRQALSLTRGCILEIVMKDTHTCRNQPQRMSQWVKIAKQEVEKFY